MIRFHQGFEIRETFNFTRETSTRINILLSGIIILLHTHIDTEEILHVVSLFAFLESRLEAAITMRPSCVLLLICADIERRESALFRPQLYTKRCTLLLKSFILNGETSMY